jgi:hypothetical protein
MGGEKLRLVVATMRFMLTHFSERDALGLVAYDEQVCTLAPLTYCDDAGRAHIEAALDSLQAGSVTNLSGGLLRGLELHASKPQLAQPPRPLQRIRFGNTYRRITDEEAEARKRSSIAERRRPFDQPRVHEWALEMHFESSEDQDLVSSVTYKLRRETFPVATERVTEAPFRLTRLGWGTFTVRAEVQLHDGRVLDLQHALCFDGPESFNSILVPLQPAPMSPEESAVGHCNEERAVVRSTFLFTDGIANRGVTDQDLLCKMAVAKLNELGSSRCNLSTFGFGADHSADLLQELAKVGDGIYCHIGGEDKIGEAFGGAFGGLLSTTHQNVRLHLELSPGIGLARAFTTYQVEDDSATGAGGRRIVTVDVGDLFAEERRDILVALSLPRVDTGGDTVLGRLSASAFSVVALQSQTSAPVVLALLREGERGDSAAAAAAATAPRDPQVERHRHRHRVTEAMDAARLAAGRGSLAEARARLTEELAALSASPLVAEGDALCLALLSNVKECLQHLQEERAYRDTGAKAMASIQRMHERQRGCGRVAALHEDFSYDNTATLSMTMTFRGMIS